MKKSQAILIRTSYLDKELIRINAEKVGLSLSQYMIDCALHRVIDLPPGEERMEAYKELAKFHKNFTYISNLIKNKNSHEVAIEVQKVSMELRKHLEEIKNGK